MLSSSVEWKSPFSDSQLSQLSSTGDDKSFVGGDDEEEDEALRKTHVEEGDESLFESSSRPLTGSTNASSSSSSETRLLSCEVGKYCVAVCDEYSLLLDIVPDSVAVGVASALQAMWRYLVMDGLVVLRGRIERVRV